MKKTIVSAAVTAAAAVRPVNVVNAGNGVPEKSPRRSERRAFKALKIPYSRTHDMESVYEYGANHVCAVSAIFPNFDESVPAKVVDANFSYGEVHFPVKDGALEPLLEPNAFAVEELK